MRVIVAGRPNPPIPDDVPDWHPLRDPASSARCAAPRMRRTCSGWAGRNCSACCTARPTEQDLLGLLTAARGGLTGPDLDELTGAPLWEVEEILHTVAGRTFTRRASRGHPGTARRCTCWATKNSRPPPGYLGRRAGRLPGPPARLGGQLPGPGWPPETPEYLLGGYFRMLTAPGDLPRLVACAGDAARHERMLDMTGGDAAALAEIRTALDCIAAQDDPDLTTALGLACHRD